MNWFISQPADLMYPYGRGWLVLFDVARHLFGRMHGFTRTSFLLSDRLKARYKLSNRVFDRLVLRVAALACVAAGAVEYVVTIALTLSVFAAHAAFLALWAVVATVANLFLALYNTLWSWHYKVSWQCPACHKTMALPLFICPQCGAEHSRLWPSRYGVFHHRCRGKECGRPLPTLDALGRRAQLAAKCANPRCGHPIDRGIGELTNIHIPVIGGPSAGKSNFTFMATRALIEGYCVKHGYAVEFPKASDRALYERNVQLFDTGRELEKTADVVPQAYTLAIRRIKRGRGRIVYFYDAAGEAYQSQDDAARQSYFNFVHGLVFIVDPLSIDLYRREHSGRIEAMKDVARPSAMAVMDAYGRMIEQLKQSGKVKSGQLFPHPIAVVITKSDALDLRDRIGQAAAQRAMTADSGLHLPEDAQHLLVQRFLEECGLGNLVRDLYNRFERVRFFSCSALGRMPNAMDRSPFKPMDVAQPMTWLLGGLGAINSQSVRAGVVDVVDWTTAGSRGLVKGLGWYFWGSLRPRGGTGEKAAGGP